MPRYTPDPTQAALVSHALSVLNCDHQDLAELLGVSKQHISNVRYSRFRLSAEPLARLHTLLAAAADSRARKEVQG